MTYRGQFRQSRGSIEIEHIVTRPASPQGARLTLTGNLRSIFCQTAKSTRPTAIPIETSKNLWSTTNRPLVDRGTSITITRVILAYRNALLSTRSATHFP
jgi:hypothetical protein